MNVNPPLWMTVNVYYYTSEKHDTSFPSAIAADSLNAIPNYVWLDSALMIMMYVDPRIISLISRVSLSNEKLI